MSEERPWQLEKNMETRARILKKKKKKKRMKNKRTAHQQKKLFPLLLAAFCSKSPDALLINKCLNKVFRSLPRLPLSPFLSLLPPLLKFHCTEIVHKSLEIIGAAALASYEMNEKVAMEDEIVKGLISLTASSRRAIAMAACNALLDLSTTSIGRQRLLDFSAIGNLLLCFIQESKLLVAPVSLADGMKLIGGDEYQMLLLYCAITLVNSCTMEQLQQIPTELSERFTELLKILWGAAHREQLCSISSRRDQICKFRASNVSINSLAESIFRLSFNYGQNPVPADSENVRKNIFNLGEVSIEQFFSEIWEMSPLLITDVSEASLREDAMFSPFIQYLGPKEEIPTFIPSMLKGTISCPAIASDNLDILHVVNEMKNNLGCPIIYNQDIRVVKAQCGVRETHYFQNLLGSSSRMAPHVFGTDDIMKCEEAFNQGYSIALRGMEFRFQSISAIADGLASLFGQPSAGVNMYLTPSNSQGLARHSDDHCVFVCQLAGVKRWTVFTRPKTGSLPRLYEPFDGLLDSEEESQKIGECRHFLLKEGDVLYIPRGFPHEARTDAAADENVKGSIGFSLHLTLAIEIEPPFEWEGFMQVALYCWDKKESASQYNLSDSMSWNLHVIAVRLLHIAIKLIGKIDPRFRKACLVAAMALPSYSTNIRNSQTEIFQHLVSQIASESIYSDALKHLEAATQRNEDPLEHIRWMKCLTEMEGVQSLKFSSSGMFDTLTQHGEIAEAAFVVVKSRFCNEVKFQDVEQHYKVILEKYRKVRKQYSNGMLSLHSALQHESEIASSL